MKKFKFFALGIIGAGLITAGLFACSNEEITNPQQENVEQENVLQSKSETNMKIGEIVDGVAQPLFDTEEFKTLFLEHNLLTDIETVEIDKNHLTIIGKDVNNFKVKSFQIKLTRVGSELFFPPIDNPMQVFEEHTCSGNGCSSCSFVKNNDGDITGCKCGGTGSCDHSVTDDDSVSPSEILEIIVLTLEIILMV